MHRFFTQPENIREAELTIEGEDVRHITKVLRLEKNECIEVCDGQGMDYKVQVEEADKDKLIARIIDRYPSAGESTKQITLFQGVPKGSKMESIIQKCVETGVYAVIPFTSKRTVVQLKDKKDKKTQRWQRVAYEAAKQSKRGIVPSIEEAQTFKELLERLGAYDLVIVAYENEAVYTLKKCLQETEKAPKMIAVIVGPEGGFDEDEIKAIERAGGKAVTLGKRILRTETAGTVLLAQIDFFYDNE